MIWTTTRVTWILCITCAVCSTVKMPDDWIDPMDPLSHDPSTVERDYSKYLESKNKKAAETQQQDTVKHNGDPGAVPVDPGAVPASCPAASCPAAPACTCDREKKQIEDLEKIVQKQPVTQMPYFKQFVARFVTRVKAAHLGTFSDSNYFQAEVSLTDAQIQVLENFAHGSGDGRVRDAHAILDNMLRSVRQIDVPEETLTDWRGWAICACWVLTAVSFCAVAINMQWRTGITWMRVMGSMFGILFLVSVPWNWWHLYQKELATRMSKSQMDAPVECRPQDMDLFQYVLSGLSINDKCKDFYHSLHIDPWVEIPPTKAIAVTITKFILEPLEHLGEALGKMIKAGLMDLPVQLWPVVIAFMLIFFVLLLVMGFGYKVRLFYLFGLEPSTPAIQGTDRQMAAQIEGMKSQIAGLSEQTSTVHHMLADHTRTMEEQLSQPQPLALPSIEPSGILPQLGGATHYGQQGEITHYGYPDTISKSTAPYPSAPYPSAPYPTATSTPYPSDSGDIAKAHAATRKSKQTPLAGPVGPGMAPPPPGFALPPPTYASVSTPTGPRDHPGEDDSRVEDVDFMTPDEASVSHVVSPRSGRGRRKKVHPVRALSDSSIAAQCGHTREEDKITTKTRRKVSRDKDHGEIEDQTFADPTFADHDKERNTDNTATDMVFRDDRTLPSAKLSSFDSLAQISSLGHVTSTVTSVSQVMTPSQVVEEVGSQDTKQDNLQPEMSSDDSDLEIIEEEPNNM